MARKSGRVRTSKAVYTEDPLAGIIDDEIDENLSKAEKFKNEANDAFKGRATPQLPAKNCVHRTIEPAGGLRREKLFAGH